MRNDHQVHVRVCAGITSGMGPKQDHRLRINLLDDESHQLANECLIQRLHVGLSFKQYAASLPEAKNR